MVVDKIPHWTWHQLYQELYYYIENSNKYSVGNWIGQVLVYALGERIKSFKIPPEAMVA